MKLHIQSDSQFTLIENTFIDHYMPTANGEFVKLYLYLLRCAGTGRELSVSSIADFFDHTEKDVRRALTYWEKQKLLKVRKDKTGVITDIEFLQGETEEARPQAGPDEAAPASMTEEQTQIPPRSSGIIAGAFPAMPHPMSDLRKQTLRKQEEISRLLYVAEQYIGRPLTTQEMDDILYFYDELKFSADLIEYLLEYCATKGNPGARFMEKIAADWYNEGIRTVEQAKADSRNYQQNYYTILKALGIRGRSPAPAEIVYMDRWLGEYGLPVEIIEEACARTIRKIHQPEFEYIQRILESWHGAGARTMEDIAVLDRSFAARQSASSASDPSGSEETDTSASASGTARAGRSSQAKRFAGVSQRDYNWQQLEQQLLLAQTGKGE